MAQETENFLVDLELLPGGTSGVALASTDANLDGLDDIIRFQNGRQLEIWVQEAEGGFRLHFRDDNTNNLYWNVLAVNLNNDRWIDIIASSQREITIWQSNGPSYDKTRMSQTNFMPQAANLVDLNQDGKLDLFVCNDKDTNLIFLNNSGEFVPIPRDSIIDYGYQDSIDYAGNYGSVWFDVNGDEILDGYISKCFQTATLPSDKRRINQLLISSPDGSYHDEALNWNLNDSAQSWAATVGDFDNDGDQDVFVLNHDAPSRLYIREDQRFEKVEDFGGEKLNFIGVQALANDFNHDGYLDLFLTGNESKLLMNDAAGSFDIFDAQQVSSGVWADLDRDGDLDVYGARHGLYNNPGNTPDIAFLNQNNSPSFIRLQALDTGLTMAQENIKVTVWQQGLKMERIFRFGDSYGICQTGPIHFGFPSNENIDSLSIEWESGLKQLEYDIPTDENYYFGKDIPFRAFEQVELTKDAICSGDTSYLIIPQSRSNNYLYTDSGRIKLNQDTIAIADHRSYFYTGFDRFGNFIRSAPFQLRVDPKPSFDVVVNGEFTLCEDEIVEIQADPESFIQWNNGSEENPLIIDSSGLYFAELQGLCASFRSDSVELNFFKLPTLTVENDTIAVGMQALLKAQGNHPHWYQNLEDSIPFFVGNEFVTDVLDRDTLFFVSSRRSYPGDSAFAGLEGHRGGSLYNNNFVSGALNFEVYEDCVLDQVTVFTDDLAVRVIELVEEGVIIESDTFTISPGDTILTLDWSLLSQHHYTIRSNSAFNLEEYGILSPRLYRDLNASVEFPYSGSRFLSILSGNGSANEYFYFYNWKIKGVPITCTSERLEVKAIVRDTTHTSDSNIIPVQLYPNPNVGELYIKEGRKFTKAILYSMDGRLVGEFSSYNQPIQLSHLPKGIYWVKLVSKDQIVWRKLIMSTY